MVSCAVLGCNSCKRENPQNYSFHVFPSNIVVRQKWLKMIKREDWVPKKNSTICSKHFHQTCFSLRGAFKKTKLRSGSVPTLFVPVILKTTRIVTSYVNRDISPIPSSSTANDSTFNNSPRNKKMMKTIDILGKRLKIKRKQLKNLRAQKKRADQKVVQLTNVIKKLESLLPSLQNNVRLLFKRVFAESS